MLSSPSASMSRPASYLLRRRMVVDVTQSSHIRHCDCPGTRVPILGDTFQTSRKRAAGLPANIVAGGKSMVVWSFRPLAATRQVLSVLALKRQQSGPAWIILQF